MIVAYFKDNILKVNKKAAPKIIRTATKNENKNIG